jgi:hypothetical protein
MSFFNESANNADVLGNNSVISVENIMPPKSKQLQLCLILSTLDITPKKSF